MSTHGARGRNLRADGGNFLAIALAAPRSSQASDSPDEGIQKMSDLDLGHLKRTF